MLYDRDEFHKELSALIGEEITGVFYAPHTKDIHYADLSPHTEYCKSYGFFIQTRKGNWFTFHEADYSYLLNFTGITMGRFDPEKIPELEIGENRIDTMKWLSYHHATIESVDVYEDHYSTSIFNGILPVGILLHFSNGKNLYILNLTVESFDRKNKLIDFSRGNEILIMFNKAEFLELGIGKLNYI